MFTNKSTMKNTSCIVLMVVHGSASSMLKPTSKGVTHATNTNMRIVTRSYEIMRHCKEMNVYMYARQLERDLNGIHICATLTKFK